MRLALARPYRGQPRFFTGRYHNAQDMLHPGVTPQPKGLGLAPMTTGAPDKAREYEDRVVAELVAAFLNLLEGIHTGVNDRPWIVMELPEAWT